MRPRCGAEPAPANSAPRFCFWRERKPDMTNLEKYDHLFLTSFKVKPEDLPGLKYQGIPLWDSLGHMDLMGDLEETFGISLGTVDVLDFSSYEKGKEILAKYGVEL